MLRRLLLACCIGSAVLAHAGQDLKLSYVSEVDQTEQPYRLYVPDAYDGSRALPLVVVMHGTGGDEGTFFDDPRYDAGDIEGAAEKHEVLVVSPDGRGITEYRGIGENDVLRVIERVQKDYRVDADRIYLTGHSMGGTGSAYLALHHPDLFAAAAPLAAAYSFPWLARNARHVPFLWVGGAEDLEFYLRGVSVGVERMRKFGADVTVELLPGQEHFGPVQDMDRIFAWLLQHRRDPHPTSYVFEADTPKHGRAWWTSIEQMEVPGRIAFLRTEADGGKARIRTENIRELLFVPDSEVFDLTAPLELILDGRGVFSGRLKPDQQLRAWLSGGSWTAQAEARTPYDPATYRGHPVATAPRMLEMGDEAEKPLANWIADAMLAAVDGADLALLNTYAHRGLPIAPGTVDIVDLIQCHRPFDQYLVTAELTGADLIEILDDNLPDPERDRASRIDKTGASPIVHLAGARYSFDPRRPRGQRIVETDLDPQRTYRVVMQAQVVERESVRLAGRYKDIDYTITGIPFTLALYGHAARSGRIEAAREGRVVDLSASKNSETNR